MPQPNLTIIILTLNEQLHLQRLFDSIKGIECDVFVVDSGSTDATIKIAERFGAIIFFNKFINQSDQFRWALDNTPIRTDWVMRLDADEFLSRDLNFEINAKLDRLPLEVSGINLKRRHIFMGRWIRFGGRYPIKLLRIWRVGAARVEARWMDEHIYVTRGSTVTFESYFSDENLNDLSYFIDKHNKYAGREAVDVLAGRYKFLVSQSAQHLSGASFQAVVKRFIKVHVYNRIPFYLSAPIYFFWRYIVLLGFLDGLSGLIYHFLQGFWYRFLVGAKVLEFDSTVADVDCPTHLKAQLASLAGVDLSTFEKFFCES